MSRIGHNLPPVDHLPIPEDVQPGPGWTSQMLEMADHIGPYRTMLIVDRYGGQQIYIPLDAARNPFRDLIGATAAATLSHVYGREVILIPTAKHALRRARRAAIIARVRAKQMTGAEATRILKTSRTYMAYLVNQTDEGTGEEVAPERAGRASSGQMHLFGE